MKFAIFNDKKVLIKDFESHSDAYELCINYCNCSLPIYVLPLESDGSVIIDGIKGQNVIKECGWKLNWSGNNKMSFRP